MAPPKEQDLVDGDSGYISDESSFYGDEELRNGLEDLARSFSPALYWSAHPTSLSTLASTKPTSTTLSKLPKANLYNPYAGLIYARQLSETISSFLTRLPPLTTSALSVGPWIFLANPYTTHRPLSEDWAAFATLGTQLLDGYTARRVAIEQSMPGRPKGTITRKLTPLRKTLEKDLLAAAKQTGCTTGKWMLFPLPEDVNRIWRLVAEATAKGDLGIAAKVATDEGKEDRVPRLICVYTRDFADKEDVRRVLEELVRMGLVKKKGSTGDDRGLYYKCDAYTHLGINAENEWGLKASLFASKDVLEDSRK